MKIIAGVDEVGRGSLIGPVYAAAVILNKSINKKLLKDSKSLTKDKREDLDKYIKKNSIWAIGQASTIEIEKINISKAALLYNVIDTTDFYHCSVAKSDRSRMNVPFTLKNTDLDAEFLKQAQDRGLTQLRGHRAVGGMRASIYNAMPIEGVLTLVSFMKEFANNHA